MAEENKGKVEYKNVWCSYHFTDDEMVEIAKDLAIKTRLIPEIESNAKTAAAQFKEQLLAAKQEQDKAARKYNDGYEMRDIECIVERNFETGEVKFIRTDTGEVARTEKMTMAERQMTIDDAIEGKDGNDKEEESNADIIHKNNIKREMTSEKSAVA